jgi:hypothetical protein
MLRAGTPLFFVSNMIPKDSLENEWMRMYLQGLDSFFHMRYEAAYQTFTTLDETFPHNSDIKIRLALCLRWMGKPVRACLMFSQVGIHFQSSSSLFLLFVSMLLTVLACMIANIYTTNLLA